MKSKNLKEFSNSHFLTNGFVGRKRRSDIAATPPFLSAKSSKFQFILHFSLFTLHLRQRRNLPFVVPGAVSADNVAAFGNDIFREGFFVFHYFLRRASQQVCGRFQLQNSCCRGNICSFHCCIGFRFCSLGPKPGRAIPYYYISSTSYH